MAQQDETDDVLCPLCYRVFLDPTTLNCGHTVCRVCLAGWYLSDKSRRLECPVCRQRWEGTPQVNTVMRNLIERLYADQISEHRKELEEDPGYEYRRKLDEFEKELKNRRNGAAQTLQRRNATFWVRFGIASVVVLAISYFLSLGISSSSGRSKGKLDLMPVATWKPADVAQWLTSLGWARNYSDLAQYYEVDGRALLHMDKEKLIELLNVTFENHQTAFGLAVDSLRESGVRMPQTLWEYKALYPGRSLYLSQGMKDSPRCTMIYLYLLHYEDSYLPFLHITLPRQWDEQLELSRKLPRPTWPQSLMFFVMMMVFPYGMVGLFAWSLRGTHTLTHLLVILCCFLQSVFELSFLSSCFQDGQRRRLWKDSFKSHTKTLILLLMFLCAWPILPSFVCTGWFYWNLYYTPVVLLRTLYQITIRPHQ